MAWMVNDYPEPGGGEGQTVRCPVCGQACVTLYRDMYWEVAGCDQCVTTEDAAEGGGVF